MIKHNRFDNLSEPQRDQILTWLEKMTYDEVLNRIALPAPEGFDFQTSRPALCRFRQKALAQDMLENQEDDSAQAHSIIESGGDPQVAEEAALVVLRKRLVTAAFEPSQTTQELVRLFSILLKLKRSKFDERKIQLSEQKLGGDQPSHDASKTALLEQFKECFEQQEQAETMVQI